MKFALAIHLFMLALAGGVAWHSGGSPFLLAASALVVLISALLSIRPRQVSEITSLVASAVLVILCPLYYGNDPNVFWLCLLTMPQLMSAAQCFWEIQHAGTPTDVHGSKIRFPVFTLGFYATLGLAFLMMRADLLKMERSTGIMLAVVITLLGWIAWEVSRAGQLKKARTTNDLSGSGFLFRVTLMGLGAVMFVLLFVVALPIVSDALCAFSPNLKLPNIPADSDTDQAPENEPDKPDETESNEESDPDAKPKKKKGEGQPSLPMRGTLELSEAVRFALKFDDATQAKTLTDQGPLYVRTLAVSIFKDDQWVRERPSGYWLKDDMDGTADGRVEVSKPLPGEIAHEIFFPKSKGHVLPALAGVTTYAMPKIFVRSDNWYQNVSHGNIQYKAWSKPVNIHSISNPKLESGNPGDTYLTQLSTPFGSRLTKAAEFFKSQRADLSGRLDLLDQYFQTEFRYSMTVENISGLPPLENFLFEERRGYCDFFASAAALMLRHMGIPSRVAYGYKDGEYDAATDTWIFRELHGHAWTEVFVKDYGWVICDFTPPSTDTSPRSGTRPPFDMAKFRKTGRPNIKDNNKLWNKSQSLQSLRSLWVPVILGLGLLGALTGFLLSKRRTPEQRAAQKTAHERAVRDQQPEYFLEFLRMCKAHGHPRSKGQTLMEFHQHLKHSQFCNDDFDDLVAHYYKSRYQDAPHNESSEHGFLTLIRKFGKTKSKQATDSH